jgi:hypothetical protein
VLRLRRTGLGGQNNAYGSPGDLGPNISFAQWGPQTIRIQVRLALDQIVLSAVKYATTAPGANKNARPSCRRPSSALTTL